VSAGPAQQPAQHPFDIADSLIEIGMLTGGQQ
jgi:hypothetical protein